MSAFKNGKRFENEMTLKDFTATNAMRIALGLPVDYPRPTSSPHLKGRQNSAPTQGPAFDPRKPECLPQDIKKALESIYSRTLLADASQRLQEFGFAVEQNGSALSPSAIVAGDIGKHGVNVQTTPYTILAVHTHGALDLVGASPPDIDPLQSANRKGIPFYVVSRAGIILFDPKDKSTQERLAGSTPGDPSYGIKVGDLSGKNSIFKKPCN
jgi:hypothetical protein